jgi:TRAP-type transport system small permease protein
MEKLVSTLTNLIHVLLVGMMVMMVIMVFGNVVLRYGFNSSIIASEEVSRWLFLWMIFLGAVVAIRDRAHLGTDFLVSRLPVGGKRFCLGLSYALMIAMCVLLIKGAWQQTKINWSATSAVTEVSLAVFSGSCLVFAVLALPLVVWDGWRVLTGREKDLVAIQGSEEHPHAGTRP